MKGSGFSEEPYHKGGFEGGGENRLGVTHEKLVKGLISERTSFVGGGVELSNQDHPSVYQSFDRSQSTNRSVTHPDRKSVV